ncbi:ATP-binding protein [Rhizobium leguminosarum]|uniref:ATP-binding protein n=1 Tax=Rhizobium leguminosarum TaxID=384 RepID=UPI003CFD9630
MEQTSRSRIWRRRISSGKRGYCCTICGHVNELVTNAFKHAYPEVPGTVTVRAQNTGEAILLEIADGGKGLPPQFSSFENDGKSLGMRVVRGLVQQLKVV